ncbi:MAG: hypothetical protein AAFN78_18215 [Pseudomonadota bacterium]
MQNQKHPSSASRRTRLSVAVAAAFIAPLAAAPAVASSGSWNVLGVDGGRADHVVVDPSNSSRVYQVGPGAGLFASDNGGDSWQQVMTNLAQINDSGAAGVAVDPGTPQTVFLVDGGLEMARSTDGGTTWSSLALPVSSGVWDVVATAPGTVYTWTGSSLLRSTDSGDNWTDIGGTLGLSIISGIIAHPQDALTLYAVGWEGVFKTIDGGVSWSQLTTGLPPANSSGYLFVNFGAIDPSATDTVYVQISNNGVYKSIDGGATWAFSGIGLPNDFFTEMVIDPTNTSRIIMGSGNNDVVMTEDAGAFWGTVAVTGTGTMTMNDVALDPSNPDRLFASSAWHGTFRSDNGGADWQPVNSGFSNFTVLSLARDAASGVLYAGSQGSIAASTDGGQSWTLNTDGYDLGAWAMHADSQLAGHVYAGSSCCGLYESFDAGQSWARVDLGLPRVASWVTGIDVPASSAGTLRFTDYNRGIFGTTDGGVTWEDYTAAIEGLFSGNPRLDDIDATEADPDNIYVVSGDFNSGGVFRSEDGGASWSRIAGSGIGGPTRSEAVAAHPQDPEKAFAAGLSGIVFTVDGGATWESPTVSPCCGEVSDILIDAGNPDLMHVSLENGNLWLSTDGGDTWQEADEAAPAQGFAAIVAGATPDSILGGFKSIGVAEYSTAVADADEDGVSDATDNCTAVSNPAQTDADGDGLGNACDADLNNDCQVNFVDLGQMKSVFFTADPNADLTDDGVVNFADLGQMKTAFFGTPGPGAEPNLCAP